MDGAYENMHVERWEAIRIFTFTINSIYCTLQSRRIGVSITTTSSAAAATAARWGTDVEGKKNGLRHTVQEDHLRLNKVLKMPYLPGR